MVSFTCFKRTQKLNLKKPQSVKHAAKRVICPIIISEEVITSGKVRERIKKLWVKHVKGRNRQGKKKDNGDSEQLKPQAAI